MEGLGAYCSGGGKGELQGGHAHGRDGEKAAAPGQEREALLGEGSFILPPCLFSISNSLTVPLPATVSSAVVSLPSSLLVACGGGERR